MVSMTGLLARWGDGSSRPEELCEPARRAASTKPQEIRKTPARTEQDPTDGRSGACGDGPRGTWPGGGRRPRRAVFGNVRRPLPQHWTRTTRVVRVGKALR